MLLVEGDFADMTEASVLGCSAHVAVVAQNGLRILEQELIYKDVPLNTVQQRVHLDHVTLQHNAALCRPEPLSYANMPSMGLSSANSMQLTGCQCYMALRRHICKAPTPHKSQWMRVGMPLDAMWALTAWISTSCLWKIPAAKAAAAPVASNTCNALLV